MGKIGIYLLCMLLIVSTLNAQDEAELEDTSWTTTYRAFSTKENDLVHTKLVAGFDYKKAQLNGEVWLQLRPHFYPTNKLALDAKGMDIKEVALKQEGRFKKVTYTYDGMSLQIDLGKTYKANEVYTVYIKYTAKPNEYKSKGSQAITDAKGLYFINPLGEDKTKPTQIWTQGETEGTSVWIPTIDKPNQKCTQEFQLTVPSKFVSLSNGLLVKQIENKNGTRVDIWKMTQPNAPYLFFIGIGDYAIVKDDYIQSKAGSKKEKKKIEISYYIEKQFEKEASKIYGNTPAMIHYYEQILGIPFPWAKYAQMSARDYVSGAMENTTCTLHGEGVQQNRRALVDGNNWETTIAHELFHQWFGDLVTAESWSNLTVNESFADYSQTLWLSHSKGKDAGEYENYTGLVAYLNSPSDALKNLVRFYYKDREDMFDLVSYQKGGRILNMLRHLVGDDAFFAALHKYLHDNQFANGSAVKLKLAFEAITGKDLNWFFNQWYFDNGHPYVRIVQQYLADKKEVLVVIQQTQTQDKIFELPIGIDTYVAGKKTHYDVWQKNKVDSFYFPAIQVPDNVNVDNDKVLLWAKDEQKPLTQYIYQYYHATNFMDRMEAINEASENMSKVEAQALIKNALKDTFYIIRQKAIQAYNPSAINPAIEETIGTMATKDPSTYVRETAIDAIGALKKKHYKDLFTHLTSEPSYLVAGAALEALEKIDSVSALSIATHLSKDNIQKRLQTAVTNILTKYGDENTFDFVANKYEALSFQSEEKFKMTLPFAFLLTKTTDAIKFKKGIDLIVSFRESIPTGYKAQTNPYFNVNVLGTILNEVKKQGKDNLVKIVSEVIPKL